MIEIEKYIDKDGLFDGKYLLIRQLSTDGGTADVWLAEDKETEDETLSDNDEELMGVDGTAVLVAIKIYRPQSLMDVGGIFTFKKEYKTVFNCHHENLLKPIGFSIIDESVPYLVMPFCEKGSTEKLVGTLSQKDDLWKFIFDTASGLAYLHSCNPPIIHQDIKPANILIDDNNNFCITDFGISVKTGKQEEYYSDDESAGTIIYMPPERFSENYQAMPESDIWSLGATIYELVTGDVPFGDKGGELQMKGNAIPPIKADIPKKIKKLIYSCLNVDPKKRPSATDLAEIARTRGKNISIFHITIIAIVILASVCVVGWNVLSQETIDPFAGYCNSGDSIINIEKDNANRILPIEYEPSINHLNEAVEYYEKALSEENKDELRKDSIVNRMEAINELSSLYSKYKDVCDSLQIAIEDEADIQEAFLREKRDKISDIIKNKIIKL